MNEFRDIQVKYWNADVVSGLYCSQTAYRQFHFDKHFHDYYTIILIEKGVNIGFTDRKKYKVGPGTILIINPGELHAGHALTNQKLQFKSLILKEEWLEEMMSQNHWPKNKTLFFDTTPITDNNLVNLLRRFFSNSLIGNHLEAEVYLIELMSLLLKGHISDNYLNPSVRTNNRCISIAKAYLQSNYTEKISLDELSAHACISKFHLVRAFKKTFGQTPFQYLRNYRIERAKEDLRKGGSILGAALDTGFFDHSHFIKSFIKSEGIVPSNYLKTAISY